MPDKTFELGLRLLPTILGANKSKPFRFNFSSEQKLVVRTDGVIPLSIIVTTEQDRQIICLAAIAIQPDREKLSFSSKGAPLQINEFMPSTLSIAERIVELVNKGHLTIKIAQQMLAHTAGLLEGRLQVVQSAQERLNA